MNHAHADMDDMGEWAESHPITRRAHRALPLAANWPTRHECETYGECNDWPARRAAMPSPEPFPVVVDRAREEFDADDQSESADMEVAVLLIKWLCILFAALLAAWVIAGMPK